MTRRDNLRGAGLMVAAMAGFAVEDLFIKTAAKTLPLGQILVLMGFAGIATFATMSIRRGEAALPGAIASRAMLIRSGFELAGRLFYALAIALTTLSASSAILQAAPLMVIAGAAVLFGEKVSLQRWLAVGVGFLGVLLILKPGVSGFSPLSLLAVAGMLGFAGRDLATRAAPKTLSNRQLGTLGFAVLALAGAILLAWSGGARLPDGREALLVAGAAGFGILGYHALTGAMRTGEVGAVTPFRYTRLVFALILGVFVLGERPDAAMLAGAALVVAAGIFGLTRKA